MSDPTPARMHVNALLPPGPIWEPVDDGNFDKFLDAFAANTEDAFDFAVSLRNARDPDKTPYLSDLEREYGIVPQTNQTEAQRRAHLRAIKARDRRSGDIDRMRLALTTAGVDVQVHANDPAVDPAPFVDENYQLQCGGDNAYAGRGDVFCRIGGGELLVNGRLFRNSPRYFGAGHESVCAGNASAVAGFFEFLGQKDMRYPTPESPATWPLVFFVGGDATRVDGRITDLDLAHVESARRDHCLRLILKFKPLHAWAVLRIAWE